MAFGVVALGVAVRMVLFKEPDIEPPIRQNRWLWLALALPIGIITGLLGLGGGFLWSRR